MQRGLTKSLSFDLKHTVLNVRFMRYFPMSGHILPTPQHSSLQKVPLHCLGLYTGRLHSASGQSTSYNVFLIQEGCILLPQCSITQQMFYSINSGHKKCHTDFSSHSPFRPEGYLAPGVIATPSPKASPAVVITEKSCLQGHESLGKQGMERGVGWSMVRGEGLS